MRLALAALLLALPLAADSLAVHSKILDEDRTLLVRVPADYARGEERYPVLYLTDAETQFEHTASTVTFLARANRIPELIVVGVVNTARRRDLTPTAASLPRADGTSVPQPGTGGAAKFLAFLETEAIPAIEQKYRTRPFRILAGHSYGGLFAIWAMLQRPALFRGVIVASPTLYWDDDVVLKQLGAPVPPPVSSRAQRGISSRSDAVANDAVPGASGSLAPLGMTRMTTRGYAAIARESPQMRRAFDAFRAKAGPAWQTEILENEDHASIVLPAYFAGLKHVFAPWHFAIEELPEDPSKWEAAVREHYAKASAFLGWEVKPPAWVLEEIAHR